MMRVISGRFVKNLKEMKMVIARSFLKFSTRLSFVRSWMSKFLGGVSIDS